MDELLLLASFAVILAGALLFTNAVEWAGHRLELGEGATGSVLAAVGTAMPETLLPIVAILEGSEGSEDVAVGAIIGAPFLLATIAMALVGISALDLQRPARAGHRARRRYRDAGPRPPVLRGLLRGRCRAGPRRPGGPAGPARDSVRARLRALRDEDAPRGWRRAGRRRRSARCTWTEPQATSRRPARSCCSCWSASERSWAAPTCSSRSSWGWPSSSASSHWCFRWCWRRWRPSCRRRPTASSGSATARTAWRWGTSPGRWSSSRRSRSLSGWPSPTGISTASR